MKTPGVRAADVHRCRAFHRGLSIAGLFTLMLVAKLHAESPMQVYTHPTGVSINYPQGWELREQPGLILLVPPDLEKNAQGQPVELIMLGAQETGTLPSPDHPDIAVFFESELGRLLPGVARVGHPVATTCGLGAAAVHSFAGRDSTGLDMQARVHVTLHEGTGIFLAHLFPGNTTRERGKLTAEIFSSLHQRAPARDPALVGAWRRSDYRRTASSGALSGYGSLSNTTWFHWTFHADGTFTYAAASRTGGSTADLGVITDIASADASRGTWRTEGRLVHLVYANGVERTLQYLVWRDATMSGIEIGPPGSKPAIYERVR